MKKENITVVFNFFSFSNGIGCTPLKTEINIKNNSKQNIKILNVDLEIAKKKNDKKNYFRKGIITPKQNKTLDASKDVNIPYNVPKAYINSNYKYYRFVVIDEKQNEYYTKFEPLSNLIK